MLTLFKQIFTWWNHQTLGTRLQTFFKGSIKLEEVGWDKLMYRWFAFFIFLAFLNEAVWRTQSEVFWVNFKVWGLLPISFLFAASQISLINKYRQK